MNSLTFAQKMFVVATSINQIPSRTMKIPARYDLLKQAASDRLLLNWFDSAWSKTKNAVLDNWESAGLIKKRKPDGKYRKNVTTTVGKVWKTDESLSRNVSQILDKAKNISSSSADEITKARNKAQRHLAEDWDAINRASFKIVDNVRERTASTIDEISNAVKDKAETLIDKTTSDVKSKIKEKGDDLKQKISK